MSRLRAMAVMALALSCSAPPVAPPTAPTPPAAAARDCAEPAPQVRDDKPPPPTEAYEVYEARVQAKPTDTAALFDLLRAYEREQRWGDATKTAKRLLELEPNNTFYLHWCGSSLVRAYEVIDMVNLADGEQALQQCVKLDRGFADCHFWLGVVALWRDDEALAEQRYRHAIELDPSHADAYRRLAELYIAYRHDREAAVVLSEGLRFVPDRPERAPARFSMLVLLAQLEAKSGDRARALSHLAQAEPLVEAGPGPWSFELGVRYVAAGAAADDELRQKVVVLMQRFNKMVCRGAAAMDHKDACYTAQILVQRFAVPTP